MYSILLSPHELIVHKPGFTQKVQGSFRGISPEMYSPAHLVKKKKKVHKKEGGSEPEQIKNRAGNGDGKSRFASRL